MNPGVEPFPCCAWNLPGDPLRKLPLLQVAAYHGHGEAVAMLLEADAEPNLADEEGKAALLVASNKERATGEGWMVGGWELVGYGVSSAC